MANNAGNAGLPGAQGTTAPVRATYAQLYGIGIAPSEIMKDETPGYPLRTTPSPLHMLNHPNPPSQRPGSLIPAHVRATLLPSTKKIYRGTQHKYPRDRSSSQSQSTPSSAPISSQEQPLAKTRITSLKAVYGAEDYMKKTDSDGSVYYELNPELELIHYLKDAPNATEGFYSKYKGRAIRETQIHKMDKEYNPKKDLAFEAFREKKTVDLSKAFKPGCEDPTLAPAHEYDFETHEFGVASESAKNKKVFTLQHLRDRAAARAAAIEKVEKELKDYDALFEREMHEMEHGPDCVCNKGGWAIDPPQPIFLGTTGVKNPPGWFSL